MVARRGGLSSGEALAAPERAPAAPTRLSSFLFLLPLSSPRRSPVRRAVAAAIHGDRRRKKTAPSRAPSPELALPRWVERGSVERPRVGALCARSFSWLGLGFVGLGFLFLWPDLS
jgi:hypothetical protein